MFQKHTLTYFMLRRSKLVLRLCRVIPCFVLSPPLWNLPRETNIANWSSILHRQFDAQPTQLNKLHRGETACRKSSCSWLRFSSESCVLGSCVFSLRSRSSKARKENSLPSLSVGWRIATICSCSAIESWDSRVDCITSDFGLGCHFYDSIALKNPKLWWTPCLSGRKLLLPAVLHEVHSTP